MDALPSSWLAGLALGMVLAASIGRAALERGLPVPWDLCLTWLVIGFGTVPSLEFGLRAAWAILTAIGGAWLEWHARAAELRAAEPELDENLPEPITGQLTRLEAQRARQMVHWQTFYRWLFAAGTAYGWDRDTLTAKTSAYRVTSQPGWNVGTNKLAEFGAIVKDQTGTRALLTAAEWNAGRCWERVPCPDGDPPEIKGPPYTTQPTTLQTTANNRETDTEPGPAGRIIEGEVRA